MQDLLLPPGTHSLGNSPFISSGIYTWERLQNLKEEVSRDLLMEGSLCKTEILGLREGEESKANAWDIEWLHRAQLEGRLRDIVTLRIG